MKQKKVVTLVEIWVGNPKLCSLAFAVNSTAAIEISKDSRTPIPNSLISFVNFFSHKESILITVK